MSDQPEQANPATQYGSPPGPTTGPPQAGYAPQSGYAGPPPTGYVGSPPPGYTDPQQPTGSYFGGQVQPGGQLTGWGYPPPYAPSYGAAMPPGFTPIAAGDRRPGTLTASAVLGYVNAGFLIVLGILLFCTSSIIDGLDRYDYDNARGLSGEFNLDAVVNLVAAGLLIGGSVAMTNRTALGRILYSVGAAITLAESVYWIARWGSDSGGSYINFYALMFGAVSIVGLCLAWFGGATGWFDRAPTSTD